MSLILPQAIQHSFRLLMEQMIRDMLLQIKFTLPDGLYYADGSIGTLKIPSINLNVKVYETESLESLARGAGHFKSTSCWDGNIGIAGHNRGVTNHFGENPYLEKGG